MSAPSSLRREVGTFPLMMAGLGSIIGSGWLFGAWRAAGLAGPGAIWAWVVGAAIVILIALTYSELGAMFPESGGMVRYSHYSHGSLVGFIAAWSNWIAIVSVIPVEAEASVQYMASWPYDWTRSLYVQSTGGHGELTSVGLMLAAVLVIIYFLLNYWSVKLFAHSNAAITVFKMIVPATTAAALIAAHFDWHNFQIPLHAHDSTVDFAAILNAVATAGIIFSFNGFQSPVNLAGEARHPARLPLAILGSILIATVIYVLLQIAYLGSVPSAMLTQGGWQSVNFRSPFAELALLLNLHWLAMLLYADAFVSPSGTGITYTAVTSRMIYGMERNGTLPSILGRLNARYGVPRAAMWWNLAVSFIFLFEFRGWGTLAAVISVATIISYLIGPVSAMTLRHTAAAAHRPLRVPALRVVSALAFIFATELMYWAKWPLTGEVILLILVGLPIYAYFQFRAGWQDFAQHLRGARWVIAYLPSMALLSWAGSAKFGGHDYLKWGYDLPIVAVVGLLFFIWGVKSGWSTPAVQQAHIDHAKP